MDDIVSNEAEAAAFLEGADKPTFTPGPQSQPSVMDEAFPDVEATPVAAVNEALQMLRIGNARKVQALESVGVQPGNAILAVRLDQVIARVLQLNNETEDDFNLEFESLLSPILDSIAAHVKRQLIAQDAAQGQRLLSVPGSVNQ